MKTDRELLELAAKAAGYEGGITEYENGYCEMGLTNHFKPNGSNVWRPLIDDGDALRLAVRTGVMRGRGFDNQWNAMFAVGKLPKDPCEATRLAIVRAAAAIGETL